MKRFYSSRLFWGIVLILVGAIFLLENFQVLPFLWDTVWTAAFAIGGVAFLLVFMSDKKNWWAILPSSALLALAVTSALGIFFPKLEASIGSALFLGILGQGFWIIYLRDKSNWWGIIPSGALLTLAAVDLVSSLLPQVETGGLFFLGLGATFTLVYLLPTKSGRMGWAIIPAAILLSLGLLISLVATSILKFLWPATLIFGGAYLVYRVIRPR